jgi:hypothetical protein
VKSRARVQELTLESGTGLLTGKEKPQNDRAGQAGQSRMSRTGRDKQDRTARAGQDAEKDRTGRAQVSRIDDLNLDLVASLELETNQSGSGFI